MELLPCVGAVVEMQLLSMSRVDLETRQWKVRDGSVTNWSRVYMYTVHVRSRLLECHLAVT